LLHHHLILPTSKAGRLSL
jgi:hypothetical protein